MLFDYPYTDMHELNLDWFLKQFKEYKEKTIQQDQKITTLEETVNQFTIFVTNYFDNLDVQQEINNKLDAMAASGELQAMLQPYFDSFVETVDNQIATQNGKITTLESRMDTFSSLTEGSTTGDAELIDARIAADGFTYPSAGDAIRGQVGNILLNTGTVLYKPGKYYQLSGTSFSLNTLASNVDYKCSMVPCSEGDTFYIKGEAPSYGWAFVDGTSGTVNTLSISAYGFNTLDKFVKLVAPAGTAAFVINIKYNNIMLLTDKDRNLVQYINYMNKTDQISKVIPIYEEYQGYLKSDGTFGDVVGMHSLVSYKLACKEGDVFLYSGHSVNQAVAYIMYNDDTIVSAAAASSARVTDYPVSIPSGVNFIVFTSYESNGRPITINVVRSSENLSNTSLWGKKINVLGDSYVANNGQPVSDTWHYKIAAKYNMTYRNYGINGNAIAIPKVVAGSDPMIWRYTNMDDDADYILVIGGTNDYNQQSQSLDPPYPATYTFDLFKTNLTAFLSDLRTKYPTQKIVFFTIWSWGSADNPTNFAHSLKEYNDAIVDICNLYGIQVFDSWKDSSMTPYWEDFRTEYYQASNDHSHLNADGHDRFMPVAENYLLHV